MEERLQKCTGNLEQVKARAEQIKHILEMRKEGISVEKIAVAYNVSAGCINRILRQNGMK